MSLSASEMTPADIAAVTNNRSNSGGFGPFGGDGSWFIIILFLFAFLGWGGRGGMGGFGGGGGCSETQHGFDQQNIVRKLDEQTYGLADATYALNNAITGGFYNAELSRCNGQAALMQQLNSMASDSAKCCCETQHTISTGVRDILENQNSNARAILDALSTQRYENKVAENQTLRDQLFMATLRESQCAQNGYLINQLRPCPVPAYITCNPFAYNGGCGCG